MKHLNFQSDAQLCFFNFIIQSIAIKTSDCYLEDSFNAQRDKLLVNKDSLSLLHFNIRSCQKNFPEFQNYLCNLDISFSIIGLTETWFSDSNFTGFKYDDYTVLSKHRTNRIGGGVSLLIKDGIPYSDRNDLSIFNNNIESLFIEIDKTVFQTNKNVVIGIIYRPPNTNINEFNNILSDLLETIETDKKECHFLGDYNINLLNYDTHQPTSDFLDIM